MPNYFSDNKDLLFHFNRLELEDVVSILEHDYQEDESDPLRPMNYEDAMDMYRSSLELCGDISANYIAPRSYDIDKEGAYLDKGRVHYSKATLEAQKCLADAGFMGVIIPREFGGLNFPASIYIMMIELVSQADASMMTMFGYQDVGEAIGQLSEHEVAMEFLPEYCKGNKIGAMVLTEPGGGSDLQSVRVTATQDEEGRWRLNGVKQFISHGNGEVLLVLARSESDTPGMFGLSLFAVHGGVDSDVTVTRVEKKMGLHGSPTCELHFNGAEGFLVGKQRFGLFHVIDILNHARFSVAAQALGIAQSAYNAALEYSKQRKAFGKTIYDMPAVADILMDIKVSLESSRIMLYSGTQWLDRRNKLHEHIEEMKSNGQKPLKEDRIALKMAQKHLDLLSPLVKYVVTEEANRICYLAQQVHGGIGYIQEFVVERCIRDVRITTIYEGTTQIQVGLAVKHVTADVLAAYFDNAATKIYTGDLKKSAKILLLMRELFLEIKAHIRQQEDEFYVAASAKELTDIYASLYAGNLMLESTNNEPARIAVLNRYVIKAYAFAQASLSKITNDLYSDGDLRDQICN